MDTLDSLEITFTPAAESYLADLLAKQEAKEVGVRIFVSEPGTPQAETCLAYCRPEEKQAEDITLPLSQFQVYVDKPSVNFLKQAFIDFVSDEMGGQLTVKAPNAKLPNVNADSPLSERINYVLYTEINPALAAHGGQVMLVEVVEQTKAVLRFGGGCQGCGMVDVTLKQGVETTLKEKVPELTEIIDATDHSITDNAYY
jgi:Fe/S biogenesis protein NfuA